METCISYELILGGVQMGDCSRQYSSSVYGRFQEPGSINQGQPWKEFTWKLFMFTDFQVFLQINSASNFEKEVVISLIMN